MGDLTFEATKSLEETIRCLCAIRGIGDQKAHLIAMRAFGEPDAFPCRNLGLRRAAGDRRHPVSPAELLRIAEGWRPWRAYAAMHLWAADSEASSRHHRG
jgi:AraC family transcriptional regulator of adaptative response / DNA-3-methyladenine glycosylase II